ncbi:1,6-anhydro-N-acetylmuramyl-L-alanine amidase AmpD [Larsenimonas rhizosphaerae]|uniref:1,6-anhydro-N-acetylmuramyl-L-alanine amidase AmpD n=1 Tax=Larsenimonas rhizosphaerae TaxID=2944682 RepID=UPI0020343AD4|nr:1,6-anhydro-N-acetylmuramyl-L-alanine amidase AmpD [Larsenimonas rhizosphaerae]MCM2130129.1 1,6-anhydro-N-acetylmuramyl-L-alanine amidase AmpD [Larsenimonas rhizosphaerae]
MDIRDNHWLTDARHCRSPHQDARPAGEISAVVLHSISLPPGRFGSDDITDLFMGRLDSRRDPFFKQIAHLRVSAHCLIRRDGYIIQYVGFNQRAWHAGVSCWQGRQRLNDFTVGVELEGDARSFTRHQYVSLVRLAHALMGRYPVITPDRFIGHQHIAPLRKTDPGPSFDWQYFKQLLLANPGPV